METLEKRPLRSGLLAPVLEVFASIQGEGLYVGEPQVFVRFSGCPLRCRWCDTPASWTVAEGARARVAARDGVRREEAQASPLQLAAWVAAVDPDGRRPISLTGGEPLLWAEFLLAWRALAGGRRLHLETAGAHPGALERVLPVVDHVSLDLKVPADLDPPEPQAPPGAWDEPTPADEVQWETARRRSLALVRGRDACAKLIVAGGAPLARFLPLLDDMAMIVPELPLVIQPVTPMGGVSAPDRALLESLVDEALARELGVRVVPQVHRVLGLP